MKKFFIFLAMLMATLAASAGNIIYYTSEYNEVVTPNNPNAFGANIVSNTYKNGQGKIEFDGEVTRIGLEAFKQCTSLTSIEIPNSATMIGKSAFQSCLELKEVKISDSVKEIGQFAFGFCYELSSVEIGISVVEIGLGAFCFCEKLEKVVIPNSVITIGNTAFYRCKSLSSVVVGKSVSEIKNEAFAKCTNLHEITSLNTTPPKIESWGCFAEIHLNNCVLKVPDESYDAYKEAFGWRLFQNMESYWGTVIDW